MSFLSEKEIDCPYCRFPNLAELWSVISADEDPELKDLLLGGEINLVKCVSCKEMFYADEFFLYHDKSNELMAFVFPTGDLERREELIKKAKEDFSQSQAEGDAETRLRYDPTVVFGIDDLAQLIRSEEEACIQGEIVQYLSQLHGFPTRKLRPSVARTYHLPTVLPLLSDRNIAIRDSVLGGITRVQELNDSLHVYSGVKRLLLDNAVVIPETE